jgi:type IV pilus assembly protein PilE
MKQTNRGFTLIEILIVVAIVSILAAVAYPMYIDAQRKGWRAEGRAALFQTMQQQERYFTMNNTYKAFAVGATGIPFLTYSNGDATSSKYSIQATACPGQGNNVSSCILLTGTLQGSYTDAEVGNLTLDSAGNKDCTGTFHTTDKSRCWR